MIRVNFKDGTEWRFKPGDTFTVDGVEHAIEDVLSIDMVDVGWAIAKGRMPGADGEIVQLRGLRWQDPDTEVQVSWPLPVEGAREVGEELSKPVVEVVRSMPTDAPPA